MEQLLNRLTMLAIALDKGDARRIQHFVKVHAFSRLIAEEEGIDKNTTTIIETAAILHDIGIHECERKYGNCGGKLQEQEGPAIARKLMEEAGGFTEAVKERVCFLIAHHHTYKHIDSIDWQILVEADFLVNFYEDNEPRQAIERVIEKIFKTIAGKRIATEMFLAEEGKA